MLLVKPDCAFIILIAFLISEPALSQMERKVSQNYLELLNHLPYKTKKPLCREIRYTYASALELKGKAKDPFVVSNEAKGYERKISEGTEWINILEQGGESISSSNSQFYEKYGDRLTLEETESYTAMNQSVETSIATLQVYLSVMGAMAAWAESQAIKEAESLVDWTQRTTECLSESAPEGSILHLEILWLTKGQSFKFHSESDIRVIASLETGHGRTISSRQFVQKWVNTKKVKLSPEDALFMYESLPNEKRPLLTPFIEDHGILPLQALLINAAVKDLDLRLQALEELEASGN